MNVLKENIFKLIKDIKHYEAQKHYSGIILNNKLGNIYINSNKHAEMKCLENEKTIQEKNKNLILFSIRIDNKLNFKNAKPCIHCLYIIKKYQNIKYIIYSKENELIKENILDINTKHISSLKRRKLKGNI